MRESEAIEREIEKIESRIKRYERLIGDLERKVKNLREVRSKAVHREELERDGVEINVVKVEVEPGNWSAITDEELKFGGLRKPKMGKQRITRRFYEQMVECKERFGEVE